LFFSKDILGDAPRIPSEPPRRAFKGEGSLTFTSPLKIPLCGGVISWGGGIRRIIYAGAMVGFVWRHGGRIRSLCDGGRGWCEFSLFGIRPMFRRNHRGDGRGINFIPQLKLCRALPPRATGCLSGRPDKTGGGRCLTSAVTFDSVLYFQHHSTEVCLRGLPGRGISSPFN